MSRARFGSYRTGDRDELMLAYGPVDGPQVLIVPPLFEEANRCRALIAEVQRRLGGVGIGSTVIDLPGTADSERALEEVSLPDWLQAVADAAVTLGKDVILASIRGGALLDGTANARARWRFSPVDGAALIRDLDRAQQVASKRDGEMAGGTRAGYPISLELVTALTAAKIADAPALRTVRLATEAAAADTKIAGPPLWRRPEPEQDLALATSIADDLTAWVRACVG